MKKRIEIFGTFLCILIGLALVSENVYGKLDWSIVNQIQLDIRPIDLAASEDGRLIFVLTTDDIIVYDRSQKKIETRIPVDGEFDRITYSGNTNTLFLTSQRTNILRMVRVDRIHDIDISGLPFMGPADAPVVIAVFDDYQ